MRVTNDHWNVLLEFAETHNEIITNRFIGLNGRQNCSKLWNQLTDQLNALGYGEKTTEEWKKTLADWKCKTKAKTAKIRQSQTQTGGGVPQNVVILSHNEERLLALMGTTAFEGDSQIEYGIKRKVISHSSSEIPKSSNQLHKKIKDTKDEAKIHSNILLDNTIIEMQSDVQIDKPKEQPREQPGKYTPRSRKPNETLSSQIKLMNNETLDVLRSIENNLSSIAADMRRIANAQENRNIV